MACSKSFLESAETICGMDVGFGKMILIYKDGTEIALSSLTATGINAAIASGAIIGIVKGWETVAGAPVSEVNAERTGTGEMKLIREEIAADTMTFTANLLNREIISGLVKAGTLNCIVLDDQGNVFGESSQNAGKIKPMKINFSNKTTSSFQGDQSAEKTIAVTARYLFKKLFAYAAGVETEDINTKTLIELKFLSTSFSPGSNMIVRFKVLSTATMQEIVLDEILEDWDIIFSTSLVGISVTDISWVDIENRLDVTISGSSIPASGPVAFTLGLSSDEHYSEVETFTVR